MRTTALILSFFTVQSFIPVYNKNSRIISTAWVSPDAPPPPPNDDDKNKGGFDPVGKYAELMGFEPEEKWKAIRYTAYYWAGFEIISESYDKLQTWSHNPFH